VPKYFYQNTINMQWLILAPSNMWTCSGVWEEYKQTKILIRKKLRGNGNKSFFVFIRFGIFVLVFAIKMKIYTNIVILAYCVVWVWNMVADNERRTSPRMFESCVASII
jgi:hypothetical protein